MFHFHHFICFLCFIVHLMEIIPFCFISFSGIGRCLPGDWLPVGYQSVTRRLPGRMKSLLWCVQLVSAVFSGPEQRLHGSVREEQVGVRAPTPPPAALPGEDHGEATPPPADPSEHDSLTSQITSGTEPQTNFESCLVPNCLICCVFSSFYVRLRSSNLRRR